MIIPAPRARVIEAVISDIWDGSGPLVRYARLVFADYSVAATQTRRRYLPWWADILRKNRALGCFGGGATPEEAAAAAWVHACIGPWFDSKAGYKCLTQRNFESVPRYVSPDWRFFIETSPTFFVSRPYNPTKAPAPKLSATRRSQ